MIDNLIRGYIGTYTNGTSKGIYSFIFNEHTNTFTSKELSYEIGKPSYLTIDKENNKLYSVAKIDDNAGVASFNINKDLKLDLINYNIEKGNPPCHISLSNNKKTLFSANYHDNKVIIYSVNNSGSINNNKIVFSNIGNEPHIHYADLDPTEKFLCTIDLGLDKMIIYELKEDTFIKRDDLTISFRSGCGPRHMTFHPSGQYAYVITELSAEIAAFRYNEGQFKLINVLPTLPSKYTGIKGGAAIKIHPNGKFLYTSNRGHNSISIFSINIESGDLSLVGHQSTFGNTPRDFSISPNGKVLIVTNQDSSSIVAFNINLETGILSDPLHSLEIPNPVCIKFI